MSEIAILRASFVICFISGWIAIIAFKYGPIGLGAFAGTICAGLLAYVIFEVVRKAD